MNTENLITSLQTGFTTVSVVFHSLSEDIEDVKLYTNKKYTYKIKETSDINVGDFVVVAVKTHDLFEYKIVRVVERHATPKLDHNANFSYKWVVSKVNFDDYNKIVAVENEMIDILKMAELEKAQEEARRILVEKYGDLVLDRVKEVAKRIL